MSHDPIFVDWVPPRPDRYGRFRVVIEQLAGPRPRHVITIKSEQGTLRRLAKVNSGADLCALVLGMRAEQWPEPE